MTNKTDGETNMIFTKRRKISAEMPKVSLLIGLLVVSQNAFADKAIYCANNRGMLEDGCIAQTSSVNSTQIYIFGRGFTSSDLVTVGGKTAQNVKLVATNGKAPQFFSNLNLDNSGIGGQLYGALFPGIVWPTTNPVSSDERMVVLNQVVREVVKNLTVLEVTVPPLEGTGIKQIAVFGTDGTAKINSPDMYLTGNYVGSPWVYNLDPSNPYFGISEVFPSGALVPGQPGSFDIWGVGLIEYDEIETTQGKLRPDQKITVGGVPCTPSNTNIANRHDFGTLTMAGNSDYRSTYAWKHIVCTVPTLPRTTSPLDLQVSGMYFSKPPLTAVLTFGPPVYIPGMAKLHGAVAYTSISPNSVPMGATSVVSISGYGFGPQTKVFVGGKEAVGKYVDSKGKLIQVYVPAIASTVSPVTQSSASFDVAVVNAAEGSFVITNGVAYQNTRVSLSSVSPNTIINSLNTQFTRFSVTGELFSSKSKFYVGGSECLGKFVSGDGTVATCDLPNSAQKALKVGSTDFTVKNPDSVFVLTGAITVKSSSR